MAGGRPTKYTKELGEQICERIATSSDGLRKICKEFDITPFTLIKWLTDTDKKEFSQQYARAKQSQADMLAEEILEIADESSKDTTKTETGELANNEWINRSRLRVDARKWLASKLAPKKYGDKLDINQRNITVGKDLEDESYT